MSITEKQFLILVLTTILWSILSMVAITVAIPFDPENSRTLFIRDFLVYSDIVLSAIYFMYKTKDIEEIE